MRSECNVKEYVATESNSNYFVEGGENKVCLLVKALGILDPGPQEPPHIKHHQVVGEALFWHSQLGYRGTQILSRFHTFLPRVLGLHPGCFPNHHLCALPLSLGKFCLGLVYLE